MTERRASCVCGKLTVVCRDDPMRVTLCHCEDCQRRTGSAFGLAAWFGNDQLSVDGHTKVNTRTGDTGRTIDFHFCPDCGSTVLWKVHEMDGVTAVAVGAFADPDFPQPNAAFFTKRRHVWVNDPQGIESFVEGRDSGG